MSKHWNKKLQTTTRRVVALAVGVMLASQVAMANAQVQPQLKTKHYLYDYEMPHGMVAHRKSLARQSMNGYFQPVRLIGPAGSKIEIFTDGAFQSANSETTTAGLMVGHIYRLKVTNIPGHPGRELYPSVEIIGRLFPPKGQEVRFAVPVHIPVADLEPAIQGSLVTRVVYLENPRTAIPEARRKDEQQYFDVGLSEDPIRVAEKFGRPMVIVRVGSRIPDLDDLNGFGFGTPPMMWYDQAMMDKAAPLSPTDAPTKLDAQVQSNSAVRQVTYQEEETTQTKAGRGELQPNTTNASALSNGQPSASTQEYHVQENCPPVDTQCPPANDHIYSQHFDSVPAQNIIVAPSPSQMGVQGYQPMNLPPWPDELLIDGGDRNLKVVVADQGSNWEIRGLDSEDTIAHFDTLDGRRIVDHSNRVAIYAPRFAAVRKIDGLGRTQYNQLIGRVDDETVASSSRRTDFSSTTLQNMQPGRHQKIVPPVGLENQTRGLTVVERMQIKAFNGKFKTFENLRLMKSGVYDGREKGRLAMGIDRAKAWDINVAAQSTVSKLQLIVVDDVKEVQETIHIKTEYNRPQLRLVKVASTDVAHPGDEVEFTIRFDNVGDQPIGNVTIIDNLTGRLEYVADSAECSLECQFVTEANSAGSESLRWEITDPLDATKGGVIRFKCRVR